jgi:hypothetical protein
VAPRGLGGLILLSGVIVTHSVAAHGQLAIRGGYGDVPPPPTTKGRSLMLQLLIIFKCFFNRLKGLDPSRATFKEPFNIGG